MCFNIYERKTWIMSERIFQIKNPTNIFLLTVYYLIKAGAFLCL